MTISKYIMENLLGIKRKRNPNSIQCDTQGPGYLDLNSYYMEERADCWQNLRRNDGTAADVKIIVSVPFLEESLLPVLNEQQFWSSLIAHFQVYPAPRSNVPFNGIKPYTSFADFWEQRGSIVPGRADIIKERLAQQHISIEDYIIIDYKRLCELRDQNSHMFNIASLSLQNNQVNEYIHQGIDVSTITSLTLLTSQEEKTYLFPAAHVFSVIGNLDNQENSPEIDADSSLYFRESEYGNYDLTRMELVDNSDFHYLHFRTMTIQGNLADTDELTMIHPECIVTWKNPECDKCEPPKFVPIEHLILSEGTYDEQFLYSFENLKKLAITNMQCRSILKIVSSTLEDLCIEKLAKTVNTIDLTECPSLRSLNVSECLSVNEIQTTHLLEDFWYEGKNDKENGWLDNMEMWKHDGEKPVASLYKLPAAKTVKLMNAIFGLEIRQNGKENILSLTIMDCLFKQRKENTAEFSNMVYLTLIDRFVCEFEDYYSGCQSLCFENACPSILHLDITPENVLGDPIKNCPNLESLSISTDSYEGTFYHDDIEHDKIRSLEISTVANIKIKNCKALEVVHAKNTNNIVFTTLPKLRFISLGEECIGHFTIDNCEMLQCVDSDTSNEDILCTINNCPNIKANNCIKKEVDDEVTDEEDLIHTRNRNSQVSCFFMQDNIEMDKDIASQSSHSAAGDLKLELLSSRHITAELFRVFINDTVAYQNNKLIFSQNLSCRKEITIRSNGIPNDRIYSLLKQEIKTNPMLTMGSFSGTFQPNTIYPLPGLNPVAIENILEWYTDAPDNIKTYWHRDHKQVYFELTGPAEQQLSFLYLLKDNWVYHDKKIEGEISLCTGQNNLLPNAVSEFITNKLKPLPQLKFLFDEAKTIPKKIEELISFFKKFTSNENLQNDSSLKDDLEIIMAMLRESKGVCRHRSQAFFLLTRYLGIPTLITSNETHMYCELPYGDINDIQWRRCDLGGGFFLDHTPDEIRRSHYQDDSSTDESPELCHSPSRANKEDNYDQVALNNYHEQFNAVCNVKKLTQMNDIMQDNDRSFMPMILLKSNENPLDVNRCIIAKLREQNHDIAKRYLFISNPNDFKLYLQPRKLSNNQFSSIKGPLDTLLQEGGIIIVDWTQFDATQQVSFKSILDAQPTLLGIELNPQKVLVIGLSSANATLDPSILSRSQKWELGESFMQHESERASHDEKRTIEVDLMNLPMWRELLLAKIRLKDQDINIEAGPLLRALQENIPLVIYNPPQNDHAFDVLLHRLRCEKKILYNGDVLPVRDGVTVEVKTRTLATDTHNLSFNHEAGEKSPFYLGLHNFHECFDWLHCANGKASYRPGSLQAINSATEYFYVTQSIPLSYWNNLLSHIKTYYPTKNFHFVLAPGVSIHGVHEQAGPPIQARIHATNDNDYYSQTLATANKTLIVDVTRTTSFTDLIYTVSLKDGHFTYQEQSVLSALRDGNSVILSGEISPTLAHQLLPLLSNHPHIVANGEKTTVAGALIAVVSEENIQSLGLKPCVEQHYSFNDYKNILKKELECSDELLRKLELFVQWASKLQHMGSGMPKAPEFTYSRLKNMVARLNFNKGHPNNPIKGLFHYDYLKDSDDYAYLSVIAKYFFGSDHKQSNDSKMSRINYDPDASTAFCWQALNAFSPEDIRKILGNDISASIDFSLRKPNLTQTALEKLKNKWRAPHDLTDIDTRSSFKNQQQLQSLLDEPNVPIIFLKGTPGSGKTYLIENVEKLGEYKHFEGNNAILQWLNYNESTAVLILDEANMTDPGTWDFLKGITRQVPTIQYLGKTYPLNQNNSCLKKIVLTGNPENFPNRHYHRFFQQHAEIIYFDKPYISFLKQNIINKRIAASLLEDTTETILINGYELFSKYCPFMPLSIRDMENLIERYLHLVTHEYPENQTKAAIYACIGEFAGAIQNSVLRQKYCDEIRILAEEEEETFRNDVVTLDGKYYITPQKMYLMETIKQDLAMRNMQIAAMRRSKVQPKLHYKLGILIEGSSGLGKSTLFKSLLEGQGLNKESNGQNKYYEISACSRGTQGYTDVYTILEKAFHEGAAVILDEINLDEELEKTLNQYLCGKDLNGNPPRNLGFFLLASQNPIYHHGQHHTGRKPLSTALMNRFHFLSMDDFSHDELLAITEKVGLSNGKEFVAAYEAAVTKHPESVNSRVFFKVLDETMHRHKRKLETIAEEDTTQTEKRPRLSSPSPDYFWCGLDNTDECKTNEVEMAYRDWSQSGYSFKL